MKARRFTVEDIVKEPYLFSHFLLENEEIARAVGQMVEAAQKGYDYARPGNCHYPFLYEDKDIQRAFSHGCNLGMDDWQKEHKTRLWHVHNWLSKTFGFGGILGPLPDDAFDFPATVEYEGEIYPEVKFVSKRSASW